MVKEGMRGDFISALADQEQINFSVSHEDKMWTLCGRFRITVDLQQGKEFILK